MSSNDFEFETLTEEEMEEASGGCGWGRPACGGAPVFGVPAYPVAPAAPVYGLGTAIPGAPAYGPAPVYGAGPVAYPTPGFGCAPRWKGWRW